MTNPTLPRTALLLLLAGLPGRAETPPDFVHRVAPILREHCADCHMGAKKKGGLSMNTREDLLAGGENGAVLVPGKPEESRMLALLAPADPEDRMPPKGDAVPPEKIEEIRRWIAGGAEWPAGFNFAKPAYEPPLHPRRPDLPPALPGRDHPVDRILDADFTRRQQPIPPRVSDGAFLRRAHLDLIGLLPSTEELAAFEQDTAPDKRAAKVRELLGRDTDYAEHWLTFWNDLLRNDYAGTGYIEGGRKQISTWLYDSLAANKPYDVMVRELIKPVAGSEGFSHGIRWRGEVSAGQTVEIQFSQNVSQAFLGINMKCASCHDSFIDRWKLNDAYGLAAVYSTRPLEIHRCDKPTGRMAAAAWLYPELGQIEAAAPQPKRLEQLAALMTHPENGRFARTMANRLWHRLMGHGVVHPVDAMETEPWNADLLDHLATTLRDNAYDIKKTLEHIATSEAYQSPADTSGAPGYAGPQPRRLTAEQFVDAVWGLTDGAPEKFDAPVKRTENPAPVRAALLKSDLLMRSLGRPNREQIVSARPNDLTTLEAIDLANGPILYEMIVRGARNLLERSWTGPEAFTDHLFRHALSRDPTGAERAALADVLGAKLEPRGVEDAVWMVVLHPEFQYVR